MMFIHHYPIPDHSKGGQRYMAAFKRQDPKKIAEIRKWCYTTYGEPGYQVNNAEIRWIDDVSAGEVVFNRESDLMMFLLRWQ